MELAQITAGQVVMLFLLIGTGIAAVKTGVLKPEGKQTLSNLLVYLVVPAMIVNSYRMEFSMEILHNLLASFGMSLLALLIGTGITLALTARRKDSRTPIFRFACIFSNAAYMGFPLISAAVRVRGSALCQRLCDRVQHSAVDHGLRLCEREFRHQRGPAQPAAHTGAVRHGDRPLHLPAADPGAAAHRPAAGADGQHDHTLSMVITGMLLAAGDLGCIVRSKPVWKLAAVRMLLIPTVCLAVFGLLGFRSMTAQVVLLLECCPSAAITSVFAVQFGHDESFAAGQRGPDHPAQHRGRCRCAPMGGHSAVTFSLPAFFMACSWQTQISICTNSARFAVFRAICGQFCQSFFILQ